MAATRITATKLARNLSDVLNRVKYKGERFEVVRNDEVVAILEPEGDRRTFTVEDFRREFRDLKVPPGFAEAIEEGRKALGGLPESAWPS